MAKRVDGFGIRGEQDRLGVHQVFPDDDLLLGRSRRTLRIALAQRGFAHSHHLRQVDLHQPD